MDQFLFAVLCAIAGAAIGAAITVRKMNIKYISQKSLTEKNRLTAQILNRWLLTYINGKTVSEKIMQKGYQSIAIYGMNFVGMSLYRELKNSSVEVKYLIDKRADRMELDRPVIKPEAYAGTVDAIIVTAVYYAEEIREEMSLRTADRICSLNDILDDEEAL